MWNTNSLKWHPSNDLFDRTAGHSTAIPFAWASGIEYDGYIHIPGYLVMFSVVFDAS